MSLAVCLFAALSVGASDTPDLVVLKDGTELECRVLFEDDSTVVYTEKYEARELPRDRVASVQSVERSTREMLERFSAAPRNDATALLDLATFCESRELLGEARHLRLRVLTLDPDNAEAWTKLGGAHTDRHGWRLKVRGRFLDLNELRERGQDWKNALELPTAHFLIRTDGPFERALDLAIDVERAYAAFYEMLGGALRLYPFDEVPAVHVYAHADEMPVGPTPGASAWFSPAENVLHVNGPASRNAPEQAAAELSDLMLFNALRRTIGKTGATPAWFRSGLGQSFAAALVVDPGYARWELGRPIVASFRVHAGAADALSLGELVNAPRGAFESGTKAELYRSQAYSLLQFLAFGEDGGHRPALAEYLRAAFVGKGSASQLERDLGMDAVAIERAWKAYARAQAGS